MTNLLNWFYSLELYQAMALALDYLQMMMEFQILSEQLMNKLEYIINNL